MNKTIETETITDNGQTFSIGDTIEISGLYGLDDPCHHNHKYQGVSGVIERIQVRNMVTVMSPTEVREDFVFIGIHIQSEKWNGGRLWWEARYSNKL